jgi:hypothetical protein
MENQSKKEKKPKPNNRSGYTAYVKYSNLALQAIIILLAAIFGGQALDDYLELRFPAFTLGFSVFAIVTVLYVLISGLSKK